MPTFPAAGRLTVTFSGASDTYAWNQQGYFELVSTTVRSPAEEEQRVIDHLIANITGMVKDKPILGSTSFGIYRFCFYPDKRVLVNYEDGHYERVFLGKYQIKGDKVKITCLDENARNSDAFMAKHKLTSAGAKEYFFNKGVYIGR
jgi:hypothetical protein